MIKSATFLSLPFLNCVCLRFQSLDLYCWFLSSKMTHQPLKSMLQVIPRSNFKKIYIWRTLGTLQLNFLGRLLTKIIHFRLFQCWNLYQRLFLFKRMHQFLKDMLWQISQILSSYLKYYLLNLVGLHQIFIWKAIIKNTIFLSFSQCCAEGCPLQGSCYHYRSPFSVLKLLLTATSAKTDAPIFGECTTVHTIFFQV